MAQKNNPLIIIVVAAILIGSVFLIAKNRTSQAPTMLTVPVGQTTNSSLEPVREISVTARQFAFEPALIAVRLGERIRLKIKSIDVTHGFALPDFNVDLTLRSDREQTVEFVADKKGEFTFFCSLSCGSGHTDMKGKLVVE